MVLGESQTRHTLIPWRNIWIQTSINLLHTSLEEHPSPTPQNITHHLRALRVAAHHEVTVGTSFVICRDLRNAVDGGLGHGVAVRGLYGIVEEDVFVVAACQSIADGVDEHSLSPRVGLVVAFCKEDVGGCAGGEGGREGEEERKSEEEKHHVSEGMMA